MGGYDDHAHAPPCMLMDAWGTLCVYELQSSLNDFPWIPTSFSSDFKSFRIFIFHICAFPACVVILFFFPISNILTNTLYHLIFVKAGFTWLFIKKMRLIAMISVTLSQ